MSRVTCYVSHVACHMSHVIFFFGQSGEAYQWRVCYQRGLPRLIYTLIAYSLLHFTDFALTPTPCMTPALPLAWQQTLQPCLTLLVDPGVLLLNGSVNTKYALLSGGVCFTVF